MVRRFFTILFALTLWTGFTLANPVPVYSKDKKAAVTAASTAETPTGHLVGFGPGRLSECINMPPGRFKGLGFQYIIVINDCPDPTEAADKLQKLRNNEPDLEIRLELSWARHPPFEDRAKWDVFLNPSKPLLDKARQLGVTEIVFNGEDEGLGSNQKAAWSGDAKLAKLSAKNTVAALRTAGFKKVSLDVYLLREDAKITGKEAPNRPFLAFTRAAKYDVVYCGDVLHSVFGQKVKNALKAARNLTQAGVVVPEINWTPHRTFDKIDRDSWITDVSQSLVEGDVAVPDHNNGNIFQLAPTEDQLIFQQALAAARQ